MHHTFQLLVKSVTTLLVCLTITSQAATVKEVKIYSDAMDKEIPATLILPDAYSQSETHFPVTYLLHGAGGSYQDWTRTDIKQLADEYKMIIVCPDGGKTSWYFDSPIDPSYQYETHVASECVSYIDSHYRTLDDPKFRAIGGLSMGGHGALYLAIRNQDVFSIAIALSAGVDIRPFPNNWDIKKRLGTIEENPEAWKANTVINLAKELNNQGLFIIIDCGQGDFFLKVNRALHQQLLDDGIEHSYEENPGAHNWDYWKAAIVRQLPVVAEQFEAAKQVKKQRALSMQ